MPTKARLDESEAITQRDRAMIHVGPSPLELPLGWTQSCFPPSNPEYHKVSDALKAVSSITVISESLLVVDVISPFEFACDRFAVDCSPNAVDFMC